MSVTQYWRHTSITADENGLATLQSPNPFGTHALSGTAWIGGATNVAQVLDDDPGAFLDGHPAPIVFQYGDYDSGSDTTYWTVVFRLIPGSTVRAHLAGFVEEA